MKRLILIVFLFCVSCASLSTIFPDTELSTDEASVLFPNPIGITVDNLNGQVVLVNSNVDYYTSQASIAVLSVDATDTDAPVLTAQEVIEVPNYAGGLYDDGAGSLYIPFREESATNENYDILKKFTLGANTITDTLTGTVASDPFGITGSGGLLYVVADDVLEIYNTDLVLQASIDLTTADDAEIDDSEADDTCSVVIDITNNRAVVSNEGGRMLVVDLDTNVLAQVIDGALNTTDLLIDNDLLYVLDANAESVLIYDMNQLGDPTATPEDTDDSAFLVATISVGDLPYSMAFDGVNNRLYVANTGENTISVVDTLTRDEIDRISLNDNDISASFLRDGEQPIDLALGTFNGTQYLFVACYASNSIAVINTTTLQVAAMYPNTEDDPEDEADEAEAEAEAEEEAE